MSSSVFERLAHQGTAASEARVAEEKECHEQHTRHRDTEAATEGSKINLAKLNQLQLPQDQLGAIKSPKRTPKQQDAFFSRLSHQETISSAAHHIPENNESSEHLQEHLKSPRNEEVFNRLYKQETATSKAHRHVKEEVKEQHHPKHCTPPPSLLKRIGNKTSNGPPIPIKMNVHFRTKEEKKNCDFYSNLNIPDASVRRQINVFHSGKASAHALAFDLISTLFHRDFMPGAHWSIGTATLNELDPMTYMGGAKVQVFESEKEAIWDWKDTFRVATAKATIKISNGDIYIDGYSYYVAG